ncbi:HAD-IIA family hydrolase [bacterium]|nr:HAD-IIA family hydrolase [bacterium]
MDKEKNLHLFSQCSAVVCDLDGTLYLGGVPFSDSAPFLKAVVASGRRLFYFTNNTSRSRNSYLDKLARFGFPAADEMLITAADCTFQYLQQQHLGPEIYLIGNSDLQRDFHDHGFRCLAPTAWNQENPPRALVLGFDTELNYEKIKIGYQLLMQDIPYIATHADLLCPMNHGTFVPDAGCFIELFAAASGRRPLVMGKPSRFAAQTISDRAQSVNERIAFIGDRLYTDIRMAERFNMVGVLVLSGETSEKMAAASPDQPKLVVNGIGDLMDALG